jgi:hypothetical protein
MINDYIRATMTVEEMVESYRCWERGEEWVPSRERLREAGLDINPISGKTSALSDGTFLIEKTACHWCGKYHQNPRHCPVRQRHERNMLEQARQVRTSDGLPPISGTGNLYSGSWDPKITYTSAPPDHDVPCAVCAEMLRGGYMEACDDCHRREMESIGARMRG